MDRGQGGHKGGVAPRPLQPAPSPGPDDELGFDAVYRRYYDRIWRTLSCLGVPERDLDDAVQDVFVVVARRLGEPDHYDSLRSWLYAVARRVAWRYQRTRSRASRRLEVVRREPTEHPASPEEDVAHRQAATFMHRFLDSLDHDQRTVYVLAEIEGLTAPEIATVVDAKTSTVYSRLRLARARFERAVARARARAASRRGGPA